MKAVYFDKDIPRILATKFASRYAKWMLYTGLNAVKYRENFPDPPLPADDWVRVRNRACGLCGTDVSFFNATTGTNSAFEPIPGSQRTFLGHENVGVISEVGPKNQGQCLGLLPFCVFRLGFFSLVNGVRRPTSQGCGQEDYQTYGQGHALFHIHRFASFQRVLNY